MRVRFTMLLIAGLAAIAIFASCGSDSGDSTSGSARDESSGAVTTSSLSKAEFIKQASRACVREGKGLAAEATSFLERHGAGNQPQGLVLAKLVKTVIVPSIERQSAAMRGLGAPAGDEQELEAVFAAQNEGIGRLKGLRQIRSFEVVEDYFAAFNEGLEDYGFTACVYG